MKLSPVSVALCDIADLSSFCSYLTNVLLVIGHPHREKWAAQGRKFKQRFHIGRNYHPYNETLPQTAGTCRVQVVRSVSDWSHGVLKECSIQTACK